ncbi:DUF1697 domain-containing protein [Streptococcus thoraltensis]|uniref:DUF1697 domain-containing protein n=1 Tax=Streptococcus thoraltensis TaxID=55085 RepID=UPI002A81B0B0|nr:DUF1697 domain-containing protein [Streptococcus thoraltensis]MDY4762159.1 DUF1697 domain-containing protein [Streptococcus thoraltensis]
MKTYICLLRGSNVGRKNCLSMAELKSAMEGAGCMDVKTCINSENIIFRSSRDNLPFFCQNLIKDKFGLELTCQILSAEGLFRLAVPKWFNQDSDSKHNAIFTIHPWTARDVSERMPIIKLELERVSVVDEVLFWTCSKKNFSKTTYGKLALKSKGYAMTIV